MRTHDMGRLVAVGNQKGTTYLVEFSENLQMSNKNDKMLLTAMFERESKREKILEARNREIRLKQKAKTSTLNVEAETEERKAANIEALFSDNNVLQAESEFYSCIKTETKENLEKDYDEVEEENGDENINESEQTTEISADISPDSNKEDSKLEEAKKKKIKKNKKSGK